MKFFVDMNGRIIAAGLSGQAAIKLSRTLIEQRAALAPNGGFVAIYPHSPATDDPPPVVLWTYERGRWRCSLSQDPHVLVEPA